MGVNTPHFFGLTPPTFLEGRRKEELERKRSKNDGGDEKNLGGKKIFRGCIKIFSVQKNYLGGQMKEKWGVEQKKGSSRKI